MIYPQRKFRNDISDIELYMQKPYDLVSGLGVKSLPNGLGAAIDFEKPMGFRYEGMVREAVRLGHWAEAMMIASNVGE